MLHNIQVLGTEHIGAVSVTCSVMFERTCCACLVLIVYIATVAAATVLLKEFYPTTEYGRIKNILFGENIYIFIQHLYNFIIHLNAKTGMLCFGLTAPFFFSC